MSEADRPATQAAILAWAQRHSLNGDLTWAVAYSGGADSTALLLAAHALWPGQVQAFHVHHGLQAAADDFEAHARHFCASLGVPLQVMHVQAGHQSGQSPEDAARQARYRALATMAQAHGAQCVLLGQHAQDQVETLLLALTRGAGLPGLAAMPEQMQRHDVCFGRPFLSLDGQALRDQLNALQIAYIDDPTNTDENYTRNRIRAQLLPILQQAFPSYTQTFARSVRHVAQARVLLEEVAGQDLQVVGNPPHIKALQQLSRARQANVLRHWLRQGWQAAPSDAQLSALLDQVAVCTTRGHRIHLKVAAGFIERQEQVLIYRPQL